MLDQCAKICRCALCDLFVVLQMVMRMLERVRRYVLCSLLIDLLVLPSRYAADCIHYYTTISKRQTQTGWQTDSLCKSGRPDSAGSLVCNLADKHTGSCSILCCHITLIRSCTKMRSRLQQLLYSQFCMTVVPMLQN